LPESQQMQVLSGNVDTRLQYLGYDGNGNLLSFGKNAGQLHSYIWGYNGTYVIADVGNAGQSEIAYTSFEDNLLSSGGWTLPSSARTVNDGVTGNQYLASPGAISGPAINASVKYIVSYWTKNATPFTISGTQSGYPIKGKTINSWTYYEHLVSGVSAVSLTVSGSIDELRLYPKSAQMTTYAFKPLIGMSEKCDEANRITRYRYEAFNRLYMILDQDRNVIKKFDYNYDYHPEKNSVIYFSKEVSGKYVRNNCTPGYFTDTVVYTVPYGTYTSLTGQATADTLAYNDLAGNGQTYANSVGQCTAPQMVNVTYTNTISQNFRLQMTNTATNVTYVFILAPNTTTSTVAGQVPQGTYSGNIRAVPDLGNLHNFNFCGHIETNVYSTNFTNIPIMCVTCATASVY